MRVIDTINKLRQHLQPFQTKTIGLVPTMGYLHEGHLSLVKRAREECDVVVMSIFVNPLQFGQNEDFDQYPRDLERDRQLAKKTGVDVIFAPSVEEMYPTKPLTQVQIEKITDRLCGATRPGHFAGVATVVSKLFHIVQPDRAYFGLKDAQQVAVITQMVNDLHFPVTIVPCEIVREPDGLAMSSRNVYLNEEERKQATILNKALQEVKRRDFSSADEINQFVTQTINTMPLAKIEYVETLSYPSLEPVPQLHKDNLIVAVAVRFGKTRLIDNVILMNKERSTQCIEP